MMKRYLAYQKKYDISLDEAKLHVDLNLDLPFYSYIEEVSNPEDNLVYLNKYRKLPENYQPEDLVLFPGSEKYVLKFVAKKLIELFTDASLQDHCFKLFSGYRSFNYQKKLYEDYVLKDGLEKADTYSARPGHSEHQTGLAVDIASCDLEDKVKPLDYEWLKENACKYGFIIRYPENSFKMTGFIEEPWHLRFVGVKTALKINSLQTTFDEFWIKYLKD